MLSSLFKKVCYVCGEKKKAVYYEYETMGHGFKSYIERAYCEDCNENRKEIVNNEMQRAKIKEKYEDMEV